MNIDAEAENRLARAGYIIGRLQRVIFYEPRGQGDQLERHRAGRRARRRAAAMGVPALLQGRPAVDQLAGPDFAGMRLVVGDALHSLVDLGAGALRLDANGFLGLETSAEEGAPAWSEGHPLSEAVNQLIASMVRKVGGFTFQELNLAIDDIKTTSRRGPDLSYDFVNRPAYHHALVTGDTEFLRLTLNLALGLGLQPVSLVHALQNHDEMTYELVHFATRTRATLPFRGRRWTGAELADTVRLQLLDRLTGTGGAVQRRLHDQRHRLAPRPRHRRRAGLQRPRRPVRRPDREDQAGAPAAGDVQRLAARRLRALRMGSVRHAHPRPRARSANSSPTATPAGSIAAAYDLMNYRPDGGEPEASMPRGRCLYGSLPAQLADPTSFASKLCEVLTLRRQCRHRHRSPGRHRARVQRGDPRHGPRARRNRLQATVLNFAAREVVATVTSPFLTPRATVTDAATSRAIGRVDDAHSFPVRLLAHEGLSLLLDP